MSSVSVYFSQVRLPPNTSDDVDEDPTGNKALWDRGLLNGASQKVKQSFSKPGFLKAYQHVTVVTFLFVFLKRKCHLSIYCGYRCISWMKCRCKIFVLYFTALILFCPGSGLFSGLCWRLGLKIEKMTIKIISSEIEKVRVHWLQSIQVTNTRKFDVEKPPKTQD